MLDVRVQRTPLIDTAAALAALEFRGGVINRAQIFLQTLAVTLVAGAGSGPILSGTFNTAAPNGKRSTLLFIASFSGVSAVGVSTAAMRMFVNGVAGREWLWAETLATETNQINGTIIHAAPNVPAGATTWELQGSAVTQNAVFDGTATGRGSQVLVLELS